MPDMWSMVAVVTAVVLAATYLTWTASRVDRLHERAAAAARALDAQLLRRAAAAIVLAEKISVDALHMAARSALNATPDEREAAENDLTRLLWTTPMDPGDPAAEAVVAASRRVALARQVHTDLVRDALTVRRRLLVRLLRLVPPYPRPVYFDIGDPTLDPSTGRPAVPVVAAAVARSVAPVVATTPAVERSVAPVATTPAADRAVVPAVAAVAEQGVAVADQAAAPTVAPPVDGPSAGPTVVSRSTVSGTTEQATGG